MIQHALQWQCVRGVTLQPIQDAGRNENFSSKNRLTVSEIRRNIATQSNVFSLEDVLPVPCNPDTLAMAYALKLGKETLPLTRWLSPEDLIAGEHLDYRNVFRVLIVQFMDAQNLDIRALKNRACTW